MSRPLEHDYIGLSDVSLMEKSSEKTLMTKISNRKDLNLKATELRLGLPGSESPERGVVSAAEEKNGYPLCLQKTLVSGAKRGFSDAVDGSSGKWVLPKNGGFDVDSSKAGGNGGGLFSPRAVNCGKSLVEVDGGGQQAGLCSAAVKDVEKQPQSSSVNGHRTTHHASKAQVVGWPPIRSFRKNTMACSPPKSEDIVECKLESGCLYVKVSMEGAPYLRKVDLKTYGSYVDLSSALEKKFSNFTVGQYGYHGVPGRDGLNESRLIDILHGSDYVLTYEDKDGDWMLVGDVPWDMFINSCRRLRIVKSSEAIGLAPRAMEKCKNRN
ncbi:hypothetical protein Nepgr_019879 [Nepenthes gracilis]|uniref:Auxin-responsive protein n=1 Tax=Nepenthes gracilis TaxID=150966 RepID=A0AAD3SUY0_NEPGR|nr:hypothetical protein Nepgr_019879 [Nepenthes gracilis]